MKLWKELPLKMGQEVLQNTYKLLETKQNKNLTCPEILFTESHTIKYICLQIIVNAVLETDMNLETS